GSTALWGEAKRKGGMVIGTKGRRLDVHPRVRTLARQGDCCRSPCFTLVVEHPSAGWGTLMLRRLLPLAFVTLGLTAPMASVAAQPFTQGTAASTISAANALAARIRGYHRWQGLTPPPASYCATMREGEAVLKQLSRLSSRAILYRAPGLALSLQQAGDRLSDELDEEEEINSQSGIPYTLYPCPVPAPYPPRAPVLKILDAK